VTGFLPSMKRSLAETVGFAPAGPSSANIDWKKQKFFSKGNMNLAKK
jgi:hypothetical protein